MSDRKEEHVVGTLSAPLAALSASALSESSYELSDNVRLVRPPLMKLDDYQREWMGEHGLDEIHGSEWGIIVTYEADPENHLGEREKRAESVVSYVTAALWIARPVCAWTPFLLFYRTGTEDDTPHTVTRAHTVMKPLPDHGDNEIDDSDIRTLQIIVPRILEMQDADNAITRAIRYQIAGLHSWHAYPRLAMMTSALEALFTTDSLEVAHKVSERIAFLLETEAQARRDLLRQVKSIYALRSSVIHGAGLGKLDIEEVARRGAALESLVSSCLRTVLVSDELAAVFAGRHQQRDEFLNGLLFL